MPEINLPTKVVQDAIKSDTTQILSKFPLSGGTNFLEGTLVQGRSITGKGLLVAAVNEGAAATITVDGVITFTFANSSVGQAIGGPIPFASKVEINSGKILCVLY